MSQVLRRLAWASTWFLMRWFNRHGSSALRPYVAYCLLLGAFTVPQVTMVSCGRRKCVRAIAKELPRSNSSACVLSQGDFGLPIAEIFLTMGR